MPAFVRLRFGGLQRAASAKTSAGLPAEVLAEAGAGNGIRTRDFNLGKVALYH